MEANDKGMKGQTKKVQHVKVYNSAYGLQPITTVIDSWAEKEIPVDPTTINIHDALTAIFKDKTAKDRKYYVITDPDIWFDDKFVARRILNFIHQVHNDPKANKTIILVSSRKVLPLKLQRYAEVVYDTGPEVHHIESLVKAACATFKQDPKLLPSPEQTFKGLTSFEIQYNLIQSFKRKGVLDPKDLEQYRFNQLRKTDLLQQIDVSRYSFAQLGGAEKFKEWAIKMKAAWTPEGQAFGLEPPKGVMAMGVWGTGKSLSVKCLGTEWGLPIIALDLGKLRSSAQGESENNVHRALNIIDSLAPCIVWIDESEKSLAGSQSSAYTDGGTTSRVLGIISTWVQETKSQVCLAMTANSLATMPVEFVNRVDQRWFFGLPSAAARVDILRIHLQQRGQDPSRYNLAELAEKADQLVGREMDQCLKEAMTSSFVAGKKALDEDIFAQELERKPRLVLTMVDEVREAIEWVGFDPRVNDGVKARYASDPQQDRGGFSIG